MESKTPQFDALLDEILDELVPHTRICKWSGEHKHCEGKFEITNEDISFLKMLRVPPPNFCPNCRRMRRFVHMNLARLFKRKCDVPGHEEKIISVFPEECPFPVYDYKYFISDEFDPFSFGRVYQKGKSPFQILLEMRQEFPLPSFLNRNPSSVNSDYSNGGADLKNGYYVMACYHVEDAWYSLMISKSRKIMDSNKITNSEYVYNSLNSDHIYRSSYIYFSNSCIDSMFLFDCRNCQNCFGCVNLRGKKYCVYNKQLSQEEYESFMKSIYPLDREKISEEEKKFWELIKTLPINAPRNIAVSNVSGVLLSNSRNVFDISDSVNSEHIRHADGCLSHKDSMDVLYSGGHSSLLYSTSNIGSQSSRVKFSVATKLCTDCEFVFNSRNINNCFMCFGLQDKSYCILNKQYSEEEYFRILDEIKLEMLKREEYVDGLGFEFSGQAYNFSIAQTVFPLSDDEIKKLGGYLAEEPNTNTPDIKILSAEEVSDTIENTKDDIINYAIKCEITDRPFRIIASELQFYREMKIPVPLVHPTERMKKHILLVPVGKKYKTICHKCEKDIESVFDPKERYLLYCEKCYQQEVY